MVAPAHRDCHARIRTACALRGHGRSALHIHGVVITATSRAAPSAHRDEGAQSYRALNALAVRAKLCAIQAPTNITVTPATCTTAHRKNRADVSSACSRSGP